MLGMVSIFYTKFLEDKNNICFLLLSLLDILNWFKCVINDVLM